MAIRKKMKQFIIKISTELMVVFATMSLFLLICIDDLIERFGKK